MVKTYYVMLTSWKDVLQRVVAWTDNPFVGISYFKEYKPMDKESEMVIVTTGSCFELAMQLQDEYAVDMTDFLSYQLRTQTSGNGLCYAIYQDKYSHLFNIDSLMEKQGVLRICDQLSRVMLNTTPLMRYLKADECDVIGITLFTAYTYTSIKRMLRGDILASPISKLIDIVYFWRYVMSVDGGQINRRIDGTATTPVEAVFIDSY